MLRKFYCINYSIERIIYSKITLYRLFQTVHIAVYSIVVLLAGKRNDKLIISLSATHKYNKMFCIRQKARIIFFSNPWKVRLSKNIFWMTSKNM